MTLAQWFSTRGARDNLRLGYKYIYIQFIIFMINMLKKLKIKMKKKITAPPLLYVGYSVMLFCVSEQLKPFLIALCSKHPSAAWAYDTQTTALGWIKEASVALTRFWWMTIVIKVKTIIVTYRSRALGARLSVIIKGLVHFQIKISW